MTRFRELPIAEEILSVVERELLFDSCTPVQLATIPRLLNHQDVAVEACTGSGKTLAFLIPVIQLLLREDDNNNRKANQWGGIIISPTRELANQIHAVASKFSFMKFLLLTGGTSVKEDLKRCKGEKRIDIVIATPGRLKDIIDQTYVDKSVDLRELQILVLDEADVLLSMGFKATINDILYKLPKQRRTGLFSATQTKEVKSLIRAGLRNPACISIKVNANSKNAALQTTPSTLDNYYFICESDEKLHYLINFIDGFTDANKNRSSKLILFFATCACVDYWSKILALYYKDNLNLKLFPLHGKMVTKKRTNNFSNFTDASDVANILMCTDVAARGIDIPDVDWIVQFDPPQDPDFFVHRVGRTARAGKAGNALIFLLPSEEAYINLLQGRKVPISEFSADSALKQYLDYQADEQPKAVLNTVKQYILADRDLLEKGTKAFISFVRSYSEHQCQFIFSFASVDLLRLIRSFVLLKIPKLTELRGTSGNKSLQQLSSFKEMSNADILKIKFKDKAREAQRQANLQKKLQAEAASSKSKPKPKPKASNQALMEQRDSHPLKRKKKGKQQQLFEEWDDLANEERLFKKFKKGKLSKKEYEEELHSLAHSQENVKAIKALIRDDNQKRVSKHKNKRKKEKPKVKR